MRLIDERERRALDALSRLMLYALTSACMRAKPASYYVEIVNASMPGALAGLKSRDIETVRVH